MIRAAGDMHDRNKILESPAIQSDSSADLNLARRVKPVAPGPRSASRYDVCEWQP